mgnify:CR=1 FL=1
MNTADIVTTLAEILQSKNWKMAAAESCTGGLVCASLTEIAGSSEWFERGYITYSNEAKMECLGVSDKLLETFGAVSEEVAKAMAEGAQVNAGVNAALSITGIAGPSGGSPEKPVGTVCFAWARKHFSTKTEKHLFQGNREEVRQQSVQTALLALKELLK